ncbi:putative two-component response regulator [Halobacteriovorax marinus SJ]|uniref:Two-component response regulator n=1 Tax=Halobacteriovorax marinus (strain ATCC BAA-682 / DSM 15412 / SJ) TaxID=862908 RepID=E1X3Y0_HALMS|nr:response regulator transcription factor [Halobacteriovorax marinus]CBW25320.1 putative two-component response regulator [Halobacteriovorax marinus SJ]
MNKILYIDDSKENLERFHQKLSDQFELTLCECPVEGINLAKKNDYDLILADILMPKMNGLKLYSEVTNSPWYSGTPIVLKSLSMEESIKLEALEVTKSDFLTHGMSFDEIALRLSNQIHRHVSHKKIQLGYSLILDIDEVCALYKSEDLNLTKQEFKILKTLSERKLKSKRELVESVWGVGAMVDDNNINTHLVNLRKKLEPTAHRVVNVRNKGFRLVVDDSVLE